MTSEFSGFTPYQKKPQCRHILDSPPLLRIQTGFKQPLLVLFNPRRDLKAFLPKGHLTTAYFGFDFCGVSFLLWLLEMLQELQCQQSHRTGWRELWGLCLQPPRMLFLLLGGKPAAGFNPNLKVYLSEFVSLLVLHSYTEVFWDTFTNRVKDAFPETGVQGHMFEWFQLGNPLSLVDSRFTDLHKTVPPTAARPALQAIYAYPFILYTPVTWSFTLVSPGFWQAEQFRGKYGNTERERKETTQEWQKASLRLYRTRWEIHHGFLKANL